MLKAFYAHVTAGSHTAFFSEGGKNDVHRATPPRGVWGYAPQENL